MQTKVSRNFPHHVKSLASLILKKNVVKPVLNGTLIEGILPLAENFHVSEELYLHYMYEMEPACKEKNCCLVICYTQLSLCCYMQIRDIAV